MTNDLTTQPPALALPAGVEIRPTGLYIPPGLALVQWVSIGWHLRMIDEALQWCWGDWLANGEIVYGETYAQYASISGKAEKTLQNIVYVCRAVEPSRRRENLSFGHHAAVASLEPNKQSQYLQIAEDNGWSVRELRECIKEDNGDDEPEYVECPTCGGSGKVRAE
jgi:hypothetical protein